MANAKHGSPLKRAIPKIERETRGAIKRLRQRAMYRGETKTPVFIFGCQRSGTNMLVDVLEASPLTLTFHEDDERAFVKNRVKDVETQKTLIEAAACPVIVFKPIADSQNADRLLEAHPDAKAIWIYRGYQDSTNSAVAKWRNGQITIIRRLLKHDPAWGHWIADRIDPDTLEFLRSLPLDDMTPHTAAALKWWLRNKIYFDLKLDAQPDRVLLVRYEDLVSDPVRHFPPLFEFINLPFDEKFVAQVRGGSVRKTAFPMITTEVAALCEEMADRFDKTVKSRKLKVKSNE